MPKFNVTPTQSAPAPASLEEARSERDDGQAPPDAAALLARMAARGRARLQQIEAQETPPWTTAKRDPDWQKQWHDLIAQIQSELPEGITPEEIEVEVARVVDEVRNERLARGH